uniref:Arginyl aminopeptidase (aminopeptidase B) n=1 Tax=Oncorhynchus mykiss TaxID=8022 RepID=A0A8C7QBN2_ONCMY
MDKSLKLHSDLAEDVATSSSFRQFKIKHFHLDLSVDFEKRTLRGTETLQLKCIQDSQSELLLDIHPSLSMQEVSYCRSEDDSDSVKVEFMTRNFTSYGTTLVVKFPAPCKIEEQFRVVVKFLASDGPGVCWLDPEQTAGKAKPYVFTQGQAVLNRSFFPCFDTPAVKSTYSASVKVPDGFTAVMSASKGEHRMADNTFLFTMEQPIPSYLVALAVGDLVSAEVGPRTRVWTEPCLLQAAKQEYDGVIEEFLVVGEKLFGPYVWGRYDVLFMPPSFPFGGMENPCLTFVTPCLLAGDRSLADVIVHEICHSWFGNLVTNLRLRWAQIVAKNHHQPGYQHVRSFLSCQGKQKYTLPVYRALWNGSEETRALATEIFSATSHQLHVNVRNYVKKILACAPS